MDFTLPVYQRLLSVLRENEYPVLPLDDFRSRQNGIIIRHDIDADVERAEAMARLECQAGVRASYFFKISPRIFQPHLVLSMAQMGHTIGYHYEDLVRNRGNYSRALSDFERNLDAMRTVVPVTVIAADGNPWSKYSNLWLWDKYDYTRFGLNCEMYLDLDYRSTAYYTDTGRRWDGNRFNVWDHVVSDRNWPVFHSTHEIIRAVSAGDFPEKAKLNIHPQRWTNELTGWLFELLMQNSKNLIKRAIKTYRNPLENNTGMQNLRRVPAILHPAES
jgi:hypothetical protein